MIIEGLLTSTDAQGILNVAPMGPIVHGDFQRLTLRPFSGSTTFENLRTTQTGVFHVVDQVGVIAEAAIRRLSQMPPTEPACQVAGHVLLDCCRWFEFRITQIDTSSQRSEMQADVVHQGFRRAFQGFNRARHAVIEAAILATRLHLLPEAEVWAALKFLEPAVQKTGGSEERDAFAMVQHHVHQFYHERLSV